MMTVTLEITERGAFAGGHSFGESGPYERLVGRAHYRVDPKAPAQAHVFDIDKAPVDEDGMVCFSGDIAMLIPQGPGSRRMLFDYGNRGNKRAVPFFNDAPAGNDPRSLADAGNGFLMRRGHSVVCAAWQGDLLAGNQRMLLDLPVASDGGRPLEGVIRTEYIGREGVTTFPLSGWSTTRSHPTVSLDTRRATLTRRRYPDSAREVLPPDAWCFARAESGTGLDNQGDETALVPSDIHVHIPAGFQSGWIYELIYTGRDPLVLALGHVAVRDFVSFLRHDDTEANPLRGRVERAYAWGRSQTGRAMRDFVYRGFNGDGEGRRVFDGIIPHVAGAGKLALHRFAVLTASGGQQFEDHFVAADRFPFSYAETTDHLTGRTDAILKRPETDPLVMHSQTASEYWQRRGSLVHTDTLGNDLPQPDGVRVYAWASSQHSADPNLRRPVKGRAQSVLNVVSTSMLFRAMLDAMDRWASEGVLPPASRMPTRADGTLVDIQTWRAQFPAIPGIATPRTANELPLLDFGPEIDQGVVTQEPPKPIGDAYYPVLLPAVDADGNEVAGVRAPMVAAPLASYTGWNIRARGYGHGGLYEFTGSTIPLPDTDDEAAATGDPRRSVLARYGSPEGYVAAIGEAARALVAAGLMLEEDVERSMAAAANWSRPLHEVLL
ncbi:alpha/beta hydrolase domain-containing protein [Acidisphaera sp. L21]|uniref:alpha/beta hydrolase domain-containing protein n=1 Tax=Acidisphaera sp. L21 TaxID=1641851 RepID=UPI00131D6A73|nr:alpha/beta hydrolase domain-containing protein [Acidisphaera sp. L21]